MLPRHVPCRHAGIARLPPRCNPSVRSAPSFHPDLHAPRAGARSGGQGWPVFGPPRQRREASLTAASTTASSIASGLRSPYPIKKPPQKPLAKGHEKKSGGLPARGGGTDSWYFESQPGSLSLL